MKADMIIVFPMLMCSPPPPHTHPPTGELYYSLTKHVGADQYVTGSGQRERAAVGERCANTGHNS